MDSPDNLAAQTAPQRGGLDRFARRRRAGGATRPAGAIPPEREAVRAAMAEEQARSGRRNSLRMLMFCVALGVGVVVVLPDPKPAQSQSTQSQPEAAGPASLIERSYARERLWAQTMTIEFPMPLVHEDGHVVPGANLQVQGELMLRYRPEAGEPDSVDLEITTNWEATRRQLTEWFRRAGEQRGRAAVLLDSSTDRQVAAGEVDATLFPERHGELIEVSWKSLRFAASR